MSWKPCWCPPKEHARKPAVNDAFRKRDFHKDEPTQKQITDGIETQDAVCDDGPEDHLLACKDELC